MDQNQRVRTRSILETLGEELIGIITPVSICMLLVVILVSILNNDDSNSMSISTIATIAYNENENISDTIWDKFKGALFNSLVFIIVVTIVTFLLVLLFYFRCTKFLKYYMGFSSFLVLGFMGGQIAILLMYDFNLPIDCITFGLLLFNFTIIGVLAVFMSKMAILITQGYLVVIGILVAYWFTLLPEWTTWVLLVAMALYDLAAVLLPVGPLRLLVELAISRDEDIPALVYEARPVIHEDDDSIEERRRRVWRNAPQAEEGRALENDSDLSAPLIQHRINVRMNNENNNNNNNNNTEENDFAIEGIGLASSGAIKLGLGDFIFYSVLVGRAAMYDYMTVYACYLAIIAGLGVTLILLAVYRKALPALPVSILLGVVFYLLTRLLLEAFVVQCSVNLLMF